MQIWEPPPKHAQDVAYRRALRRRHDPDASRQPRQGLLTLRIKKSFGCERLLQLLERKLQRPQSHRLDMRNVNLIFAPWLVDANRSAHCDVQSILGAEFQAAHLIAKAHTADLRLFVLQREIQMPRLRRAKIRDFTLDPQVAKFVFEQIAYTQIQLADAPDVFFRNQIQ